MKHPYPALPGNSPDTPSGAQQRGWAELAEFVASRRMWSMAKTGRALCPTGTLAIRRMETAFGEFSFTIGISRLGDWHFTCSGPEDGFRYEIEGGRDVVIGTVRLGERALCTLEALAGKYASAEQALADAQDLLSRSMIVFLSLVLGVSPVLLDVLAKVIKAQPTTAEREFASYFTGNGGWTIKPWRNTVRARRVVVIGKVGLFTFLVWPAAHVGPDASSWCAQVIRRDDSLVQEWFDHRDVVAREVTMMREALETLERLDLNAPHCRYMVSRLTCRQLQFLRRAFELPNGTDADIAAAVIHKVTGMWIPVEPHHLIR